MPNPRFVQPIEDTLNHEDAQISYDTDINMYYDPLTIIRNTDSIDVLLALSKIYPNTCKRFILKWAVKNGNISMIDDLKFLSTCGNCHIDVYKFGLENGVVFPTQSNVEVLEYIKSMRDLTQDEYDQLPDDLAVKYYDPKYTIYDQDPTLMAMLDGVYQPIFTVNLIKSVDNLDTFIWFEQKYDVTQINDALHDDLRIVDYLFYKNGPNHDLVEYIITKYDIPFNYDYFKFNVSLPVLEYFFPANSFTKQDFIDVCMVGLSEAKYMYGLQPCTVLDDGFDWKYISREVIEWLCSLNPDYGFKFVNDTFLTTTDYATLEFVWSNYRGSFIDENPLDVFRMCIAFSWRTAINIASHLKPFEMDECTVMDAIQTCDMKIIKFVLNLYNNPVIIEPNQLRENSRLIIRFVNEHNSKF